MNQMVLYSKVVTIRDKQLQENKRLEDEWLEEQKKLDLMMEIERLKDLKEQQEREVRRKVAGQREQEVLEKEKAQMLSHIEKLRQEDLDSAAAKKQRVKIMMEEVAVANKQAIQVKEQAK